MHLSPAILVPIASVFALVNAQGPLAPVGGSAGPDTEVKAGGKGVTHRVHQVEGRRQPPGPIALSSAYAKYGKTPPTAVVKAAQLAAQTGTVKAKNYPAGYDREYLANVTIGKSKFLLDFDTGSSDLWVFSTLLPVSERGNHHLYQLTGQKITGESWAISYGDGSGASGKVYADSVKVGAVTATIQAVEAATSVSSAFVTGYSDGLLGLGFEEGNKCVPRLCNTFMTQVGSSLAKNLFTATLKKGAPGSYDFGFIDSSKYTGQLTYSAINDIHGAGYWEFVTPGYAIGNGAMQSRQTDAIADTGTSLALVDKVIATAFYAPVTGAHYNSSLGAYVFPCNNVNQLPNLSFYIGGVKKTMPGSYGLYGGAGFSNYCYGGVQSNTGIGFTILGDVFLKSQYVVFDVANNQVGMAQQAGVAV